ncbi:MAG TPA: hypothetical protein VHI75_02240 [Casimicrobiaceae bacterium]|nr:hypothetical protein [Casimicrobiaceae bacterium]
MTCVTGLVLVRFGDGMREPVTWVGARMIAGGDAIVPEGGVDGGVCA